MNVNQERSYNNTDDHKQFFSFKKNYKKGVSMCKNCGAFTHHIKQCSKPIMSYGLICFKNMGNDDYRYLLIQRKHSIQFISLIRGQYDFSVKGYSKLCRMFMMMTPEEKDKLMTMSFNELMRVTSTNVTIKRFEDERRFARDKYMRLKEGVTIKFTVPEIIKNQSNSVTEKLITLESMIQENPSVYDETEWGFPKGRRNLFETDEEAARREFREETNYLDSDYIILKDLGTVLEDIMGTNGKPYSYNYFISRFRSNYEAEIDPLNRYQKVEINDIRWVSVTDLDKMHIPAQRIRIIRDIDRELRELNRYP